MSVGLPSDDVAEDFKSSLEDLVENSRPLIMGLTTIARENVEHASAICRVLESHIKSSPPNRKLPALYLLDSIVKNIGTPYTLFLSRNLYTTFMSAYSLVNGYTRQKLDEMLATWRQPNIGSTGPTPVFPQHVTKPIEDALLKARNAAIEQNQRQASMMQQNLAIHRQISTAPQASLPNGTPAQSYPAPYGHPALVTHYPQMNGFSPSSSHVMPPNSTDLSNSNPIQHLRPYQAPPPPIDLPLLHKDIADLVRNAQAELAMDPTIVATQECLQALMSLQLILQQQYHPPEQLQQIRDQVTSLQVKRPQSAAPNHTLPYPEHSLHVPSATPSFAHSNIQQPRMPSPLDIQALLSSRNLASIIASAQKGSSAAASSQATGLQTHQSTANSASDLIASLTRAGLLNANPLPVNSASNAATNSASHPSLARLVPLNDLQLTPASLKSPRLDLVSLLYESQHNQCTTCGRRFALTEVGRARMSRHYDWHFNTNQRINTSSKRAQNRSWYVDELDWIKSRDDPEGVLAATSDENQELPNASQTNKVPFIPVPTDQILVTQPCPICQEKFKASYNDEVSDWVWMDAIKIADSRSNALRVYHASCHQELKKIQSREHTPARTDTPDSILGKRKANELSGDGQAKLIKV